MEWVVRRVTSELFVVYGNGGVLWVRAFLASNKICCLDIRRRTVTTKTQSWYRIYSARFTTWDITLNEKHIN